ncbi:hypothetical protein GCM10010191_01650 [Actinomadura vinacea]|uniref:Resolvase/invertase-type recombinase catalytic domain-containing protein n=1 Tax=Actinomadura vinacea TaxID=115336 RepID=A0ABN3I9Q2_9ACTN
MTPESRRAGKAFSLGRLDVESVPLPTVIELGGGGEPMRRKANAPRGDTASRFPGIVTGFLRASRQVVSIGFKPDRLNEDAWELLDQTQAFIATRLDGVLAIHDDGVYDRDLQRQVGLGRS